MKWQQAAKERAQTIEMAGRWRTVRDLDASGPTGRYEGAEVVTFASNDYLGFTQHPEVKASAAEALDRWGAGAGSARLIVGSRPIHSALEGELAEWKQKERALLFPNGYAANLGVLSTLAGEGTTIFSDELNHASIVDGCRLAQADVVVYPHRHVERLAELMRGAERALVVTDAVFSMDGDVAPIDDLVEVCRAHDALLVVDEAHAVLGPDLEATDVDRIRVGTLSKFLGAMGGFVAADAVFIDLLTNAARPFIFTTASTPADAAAGLTALRIYRSSEGEALKGRLRSLIDMVVPGHPSPIVPLPIGDENEALTTARALLERGFLVPAIRPPSVPPGASRLRLTLSAAHSEEQVEGLLTALDAIVPGWRDA